VNARKAKTNPGVVPDSGEPRAARARSVRNALRHGLSIPVRNEPTLAPQIEALADKIAGGADAPAEVRDTARAVAEAHIDVCRVLHARHQLLERALAEHYEPRQISRQKIQMLQKWLSPKTAYAPMPQLLLNFLVSSSIEDDFEKWGRIVTTQARALSAFDRYERRALSRRARAIELLDATRTLGRSVPHLS
jgi:hypothetical protein